MRKLLIIRHAKSDWGQANLADFARTLNERGHQDAPVMGRRLAEGDVHPDRMISSPAMRAKTTAMILAAEMDYDVTEIDFNRDIYDAGVKRLLRIVKNLDDRWQHVALVGHNPGLTELASTLGDTQIGNIPTCGMVSLELDITYWIEADPQCGKTIHFDYPKRDQS